MKKKIIITVSVIVAVFVLGITVGLVVLSFEGMGISSGYCLKTDNGSCFLIRGNTPIRLSSYSSDEKLSELETGDKVFVIHDGIQESYPAATMAYFLIKTDDGSIEDIPEEVLISLEQLGWIKKENTENITEHGFTAEYVRTDCPFGDVSFPLVTVIDSSEKLEEYKNDNTEKYGLGESFTEEAEKYKEDFFSESSLILVYLSEGSGSISHDVKKVIGTDENTLSVYIDTNTPEAGTCDMAYHHIFISVEKGVLGEKEVQLFIDGKNMAKKWENVTLSKDYANFTVSLPEKWAYVKNENALNDSFGISFYHEDAPESTISIEFLYAFGVCGTGLTVTDITIGEYEAVKGTYDGNPTWDYIHFSNAPGEYVIYNNADSLWWKEYGEEAEDILNTLKIAEGIIFREEALEAATKNAEGNYKRTYGEFDHKQGVWDFVFTKTETEYHVKINSFGEIIT